jgi:hypothetical protein
MYNLTEQEIQELLEMGIDPSSVVSAYDQADFGTFVNNTVGKVKNFITGTSAINPAAPNQGGTAFNLAGGTGSSIFNTATPLQVQNATQPTQYTMTASGAPIVSSRAGTPSLIQRLSSGVEKGYDKLEEKYKDKLVDKDGKPKVFKPFEKFGNNVMAGISYGAGMNQAAQVQAQNRMANQSPFRAAGNTKEYYDHDFVGENDPLFFLNSRMGSKVDFSYNPNGVPIEAEGGEFYLDPDTSVVVPIQGPSHEKGGVKMIAKPGSYILSDNLKVPGSIINGIAKKEITKPNKDMTISDAVRKFPKLFNTKNDVETLSDKNLDKVAKDTLQENIRRKTSNLSKLLAYQQQMNGGHGEQQEQENPQGRYGMKADGGIKLPERGVRAISGFEHTKGKADPVTGAPVPMPTSLTGGENYPLTGGNTNPDIWNQFTTFINNTIGPETYNRLPEDVQTLLYNFAFVSGIDTPERQRRTLAGLAQAIGHASPEGNVPDGSDYRNKLSTQDAVNIIKGVKDFSKLNDIANNYVNVQGPQLASIAYHPDNKIPAAYRETMTGRAIDVYNRFHDADNLGNPTTPTAQPTAATQVGTPASTQNTPLDQPRIDAINQLVSKGKLTQDQGNILKQATIKPNGSLSIPYSAKAASIDQNVLKEAASYLGNRYIGFSNIPEDVKTIYGQGVSMVPGSKREEYFDKVSNKTFNSLDEYNKFRQENPKLYEDYGKSLEHYTTQKEYYGDKMYSPKEALDILNRYNGTKSIDYFILNSSKVKGADGKPDPEKLDELVKAFNSLQGIGEDGKKQFQYKDKKGKTHIITQNSTPGYEGKFFAGLDPEMAAAYYVYKTYGKKVYDENKGNPTALKNIWGKEAIGLNDEDLKSEAWTSGKFFDANWAKKNEATMPAGLRAALGNDNKFGMDHMDPRYQKVLNIDPEKRVIPGFGEMEFEGDIPQIPEIPKDKGKSYKANLPFMPGLLPSPRTQNYLPEFRQERYEPNLVSLRSAKNDQVAAMNSMLQQQGMNPATMSARQASLYGEAAKNIGAITEQENNANAQILNQAKAQNAQMANQIEGWQQQANHQYVTENAQDLAALENDRYQKLSDLITNRQKLDQYNTTLQFADDTYADKYNLVEDENGNKRIVRNTNPAGFGTTLNKLQQQVNMLMQLSTPNLDLVTNPTTNSMQVTPTNTGNNASSTASGRQGLYVRKKKSIFY